MKKNYYDEILKTLNDNDWITAKRLASSLHISEKSVRNYINSINSQQIRILSSSKGYKLNQKIESNIENKPVTQQERIFYIVKALINHENDISSYDICEKLFISEATLSKDIAVLRNSLQKFDLTLKKSKGVFYLQGSEENKRRLVRELIIGNDSDFAAYCMFNFFNDSHININDIKKITIDTLQEFHLYINDYALSNILVHTYITLHRLLKKKQIGICHFNDLDSFPVEKQVAKAICKKFQERYGVSFSDNEIHQFTFLLITKTSSIDFYKLNQESIEIVIGTQIYQLAQHLIKEIHHHFLVDIYDEEFLLKFSLHLKNTLFRMENNCQERNSMTADIKTTYPLIYDIAVFLAIEIKKMTNLVLKEGEITFLAIHIGSIIDSQNRMTHKLKCVLFYQKYYDYHQALLISLNKFCDDLEIVALCSDENELKKISFDLLLSTIPLHENHYPMLLIHPFLTALDERNIHQKIMEYKQNLNFKIVTGLLQSFFEEDLFATELYFKDRFEMIQYMAEQLIKKGYADAEFTEAVLEREHIASTSFDNYTAIPHTIEASTKKNTAYVVLNKNPMQWDCYPVNLIILIGINKEKQSEFNELYTHLLNILDEPKQMEKLLHCTDYQTFLSLLTQSQNN